jgi:hypothetical protein
LLCSAPLTVEFSGLGIAIKIKEPIIGTSRRDVIMACIDYFFSFLGYILPLFYFVYPPAPFSLNGPLKALLRKKA